MKLRNMLKEHKGDRIYPDHWTMPEARLIEAMKPTDHAIGFGVLNDYSMDLIVSTHARCNSVQWDHDQRELCVRRLFQAVFSETEMHIRRAMTAVYGQDADEALSALSAALETFSHKE